MTECVLKYHELKWKYQQFTDHHLAEALESMDEQWHAKSHTSTPYEWFCHIIERSSCHEEIRRRADGLR
jgi:hypothetical protein